MSDTTDIATDTTAIATDIAATAVSTIAIATSLLRRVPAAPGNTEDLLEFDILEHFYYDKAMVISYTR